MPTNDPDPLVSDTAQARGPRADHAVRNAAPSWCIHKLQTTINQQALDLPTPDLRPLWVVAYALHCDF